MTAPQEALFGGFDPPPRRPTPPRRKAKWSSSVRGTGKACDDCLFELYRAGGRGPLVPRARWQRTAVDGSVRAMCYRHAQEQRRVDHLDPLPPETDRRAR